MQDETQSEKIQVGTPLINIRSGRPRKASGISFDLVESSEDEKTMNDSLLIWRRSQSVLSRMSVSSGQFVVAIWGVGAAIVLVTIFVIIVMFCTWWVTDSRNIT